MRILQVHNLYQQAGGEDAVVASEAKLLTDHGQDVRLWSVDNAAITGPWAKLGTAWQVPYSHAARRRAAAAIADFAPDVVHVHNFFPLITPSVYDACRDAGVPVVQTLHNYRTICAGALLLRQGRPCEDCIRGSPYQGALHGCYRDSRLGSLAVARMIARHRGQGTWRTKVDRFIALTEFARKKFVEAWFPADKIAVKPNFAADTGTRDVETGRDGALFVGRLSSEKGIGTLLAAWRGLGVPLRIAGDGPLTSMVRGANSPNVAPLGSLSPEAVTQEMARAAFLVMPSEWYEGFPVTLAEAFCQGLPVIASRLGAMAEIVEDGVTGLHFAPGDAHDLAAKVRWAAEHPGDMRRMGANAQRAYQEKYAPDVNYDMLFEIYQSAVRKRGPS